MNIEDNSRTSFDQTSAVSEWLGGGVEVRPIPDTPGYYASRPGLIVSARVYKKHGHATFRVLRTMTHSHGYPQVNLSVNGKTRVWTVHVLIARTFLPPPLLGQTEIRHKDDDPENNDASNLVWGTHADNMADMESNGGSAKGERNGHAKVAEIDVLRIRRLAYLGIPQSILAEVYGIKRTTVGELVRGETWSHVE